MKKILIILSSLLIIVLVSAVAYISYHTQNEIKITNITSNSSDFMKQNDPLSYSYNMSSKTTKVPIEFTFNQPTIDERNPFVKDTMRFESQVSDNNFKIEKINLGNILISFNNFAIQIHGPSEDLPWDRTISNNDIFINTVFFNPINRLDYSSDQNQQNYLKIMNLNYKYIYFYTNEFNTVCPTEAPKNIYCGKSITLSSKDKKLKGEFGLSCLTNDKANILKCDEFIQNLNVSKNEIKLF